MRILIWLTALGILLLLYFVSSRPSGSTKVDPRAGVAPESAVVQSAYQWSQMSSADLLALYQRGSGLPFGTDSGACGMPEVATVLDPGQILPEHDRCEVRWLSRDAAVVKADIEVGVDVMECFFGLERLGGTWMKQAMASRIRWGCTFPAEK